MIPYSMFYIQELSLLDHVVCNEKNSYYTCIFLISSCVCVLLRCVWQMDTCQVSILVKYSLYYNYY